MRRICRWILLLLSLNLMWTELYSQNRDTELWTGGAFNLRINKKLSGEIEQQLRLNDTLRSLKSTFTELGLRYRINKYLGIKGNYRYSIRQKKNNRSRLSMDINVNIRKKKFPLRAGYRLRIQDEKEQNSGQKFTYLRNKAELEYNLSNWVDPYVSGEIYYRFNQKNESRTFRFTIGLDWKVSKRIDISSFYRIQREMNIKDPQTENIFGLLGKYNFRVKKKSDNL